MSKIEKMPVILDCCKRHDPCVLFIVGRPKDDHVVCYIQEKGTIVPYWRMQDGSKVEPSYFEKLVLAVTKGEGQFNIISLPDIIFTLSADAVHYSDKTIAFVFLGEPKRFFNPSPSYIIIKYTDHSHEKIYL
tara:strand:- start:452 stop:847 length:396 start_codon:yes stop_codon:yes gene_type:complete